jgi:hypothetical protein
MKSEMLVYSQSLFVSVWLQEESFIYDVCDISVFGRRVVRFITEETWESAEEEVIEFIHQGITWREKRAF